MPYIRKKIKRKKTADMDKKSIIASELTLNNCHLSNKKLHLLISWPWKNNIKSNRLFRPQGGYACNASLMQNHY